jgi:hypothetical protein
MSEPEIWLTDEEPPRRLRVLGVAAVDPDCLVAYLEGSKQALWIVEWTGYVCGLSDPVLGREVHARRVFL